MTIANWLYVAGIVIGGGVFFRVFLVEIYKRKPETQTLVMSSGETGVRILDGVIDTLQEELARRDVAFDALSDRLQRCEDAAQRARAAYRELVEQHQFDLAQKDQRIEELTELVREARSKHIEELERQLGRLRQDAKKPQQQRRRKTDGEAASAANQVEARLRDLRRENGDDGPDASGPGS